MMSTVVRRRIISSPSSSSSATVPLVSRRSSSSVRGRLGGGGGYGTISPGCLGTISTTTTTIRQRPRYYSTSLSVFSSLTETTILKDITTNNGEVKQQQEEPLEIRDTTTTSSTTGSTDIQKMIDTLIQQSLTNPEDAKYCNIPLSIKLKIGKNLHLQPYHPLNRIHQRIVQYFNTTNPSSSTGSNNNSNNPSSASNSNDITTTNNQDDKYTVFTNLVPIVSVQDNFDNLLIPDNHVSRQLSDTYYMNKNTVLRCHTSAHQIQLLKDGYKQFLVTGDVYRRDEIDATHYPIFHQMEGIKLISNNTNDSSSSTTTITTTTTVEDMVHDLQLTIEGLVRFLFNDDQLQVRWVDAYFPFTNPSYELEIYYNNEWLEVLGCGIIHPDVLRNANIDPTNNNTIGWAFGLGLERLAMILYSIPDIRYFWTDDERFHNQFNASIPIHDPITFQPYSKYPPCYKDISFWIPTTDNTGSISSTSATSSDDTELSSSSTSSSAFHVNDMNEIIRNIGQDLIEEVKLIDEFQHPKTQRISHCYRIMYRSMDRSLTNNEIDQLQNEIRHEIVTKLNVELR